MPGIGLVRTSPPPFDRVITDADGNPGLLIRRFDRITVDRAVHPLAVEDGCQVCDRPPADKYLLSTDQTFTRLAAVCDASSLAGRDLIRQLVFAYLIGNRDAHAKNFSVVQTLDGEWRVSPLYDSPSSYLYGDTTWPFRSATVLARASAPVISSGWAGALP